MCCIEFGVNQILTPDYEGDTKLYQSFEEAVRQYQVMEIHPQQEEVYSFGTAQMEILGPVYYGHSDGNEDSICIRVTNGENSFLICGDIGEDTETELVHTGVDVSADVYLLNHHGSNTSSTQEFLESCPAFLCGDQLRNQKFLRSSGDGNNGKNRKSGNSDIQDGPAGNDPCGKRRDTTVLGTGTMQ